MKRPVDEQKILRAARESFGPYRYTLDFGFGVWWLTCFEDRRMWVVTLTETEAKFKLVRREDEFV